MASNIPSFPRMLKMLRENSSIKDKREALTYIRSSSKKLEQIKAIKEEQYKELYKLVIDVFTNGNSDIQNEAYETLNVIIQDFKDHSLNLFETMSQISQKNRLKILKLLEIVEDNAISMVIYDTHIVNFLNNCMCMVQTSTMPWIAPNACIDNIQALTEAESKPLSDDQRLEEETINYCMILLRRLYKVAAITSDTQVQRFNALLLDKIMLLAYMGHKRQRGPALKLLEQALTTDITSHVRSKLSEAWSQYKLALQSTYCKRMLLLVSACELDWATQWNISIQFLGMDLHRGAGLINNLLSVEEKAFKSTDTVIRRQAFLSWKLLVDNFALDPQELATARRIKLLCIPLNAKNSKSELIALTKLEVWWHVIIKLYKDIHKFVNPVVTQFLNFCFGPLGDTPLLSSKFEIVASPGKRFYKTKIIAVDALCQLLVNNQENTPVFSPILEERLPHSITSSIFQDSYKSVIHSVGEAWLVLSQLTDSEMKNRYQLSKILWASLVNYIQESKTEMKDLIYRDLILVITELTNCATDKPMIKNLILDTILFNVADLNKNFIFEDDVLLGLILKLIQIPLLNDAKKSHYDILKCLFWQCIKSETRNEYYSHAFKCLKEIYEKLSTLISVEEKNETVISELWQILAEVTTKYMDDFQEINEGNALEHNFKTVESIVIFPFMYLCSEDNKQAQELVKVWKSLFKQFEMRADLVETVKSNEILLNISNVMQGCIVKNEKSCCLITKCLDILLSTVNFKFLLANVEVPSVIHLIVDLIACSLSHKNATACESALKALSAVLITIYGHTPQKVISYLQVCKPTVEQILSSKLEEISKEVLNTWEIIVSILKGLNKLVDYDLILSYKKAIIFALNHKNLAIQNQTVSLFDIMNVLSGNAKSILQEIEMEAGKDKISRKSDGTKKSDLIKSSNQIKMVGSFLNRRSCSPKSTVKESGKNDKRVLPDSNSEDYVFIKSDYKFDVSRLTEHQKESLKRRREDIPALYNDLSQSSSQDTQNLQEWFDKRNDALATTEKVFMKRDNITIKNIINDEANKENKIDMEESEMIDKAAIQNDVKSVEHGQNTTVEFVQNSKDNVENDENIPITDAKAVAIETCDNLEVKMSSNSVTGDANLASQEERLINKDNDQRLSPSVLDNSKRRSRQGTIVTSTSTNLEETNSQPGQSNMVTVGERKLRKKISPKPILVNKQRLSIGMKSKSPDIEKRGIKRKSNSDSENESSHSRRRSKTKAMIINYDTPTDSDSSKSTESENPTMNLEGIIEDGNLSQRTRNEISRLRINMVFDSPLSNSRRSKGHEDSIKDGVARKQSPECKVPKLKVADLKPGDSLKKNQKSNDKELNKTQYVSKRGRLIKAKFKVEKNGELTKVEDTKKSSQNKTKELGEEKKLGEESKEDRSVQIDVSRITVDGINGNGGDNGNLYDVNQVNKAKVVESKDDESNTEVENKDVDYYENVDIIENSQELSEIQRKCNEKQCFIKINKIGDPCNAVKLPSSTSDNEIATDIVSNNCDNDNNEVPKVNVKESEENMEVDSNKPKTSISVADGNLYDNEKYAVVEVQKMNEGSSSKYVLGFSSPKSNTKRQLKFKTYSALGRAAHMLGLVTKQAKLESECNPVTVDDEAAIKKGKPKDIESETGLGKKEKGSAFKDVEKVTATCSSRQEKIFNNMRTSDYGPLPSIKSFSNLKNDGEKVFLKTDKMDLAPVQADVQVEKVNEESVNETEELPILEWSSANPPSLTASPSVSILKRQRQSLPEPDPECTTPNKRKRVSFADPPVSKEMGYEIATSDSPHKLNKFVSRGLLGRKDSPFRMKQIKPRLIHIDSEKMDCEEETDAASTSEVDQQCERENELLTKIAEELEYSGNFAMDTDSSQISPDSEKNDSPDASPVEDNARNKINIDNLSTELEITQNTTFSRHTENKDSMTDAVKEPAVNTENDKCNVSDTNDDIFNEMDAKRDNANAINNVSAEIDDGHNVPSVQNNAENSLKYNIANDSVIPNIFKDHSNSENLEDTMDVANLSSLNSTASSEEIFCGRLIRTSTQAVDTTGEQDTLPVTDSVLGTLPLSHDSQNTSEFDAEIPHPELLDSTHPIHPTLISCSEPIQSVIEKLTNPLWVSHLSTYLSSINIETVGNLARLSEREVNRIPVKGNSKVDFVKSVLKSFEKTYNMKQAGNATERLNDPSTSEPRLNVNTNVPVSEKEVMTEGQALRASEVTPNEIRYGTDDSNMNVDKMSELSKIATEIGLHKTSNQHALKVSSLTPQLGAKTKSSTVTQMTSIPVSSILDIVLPSQADGGISSISEAISASHMSKTIDACTTRDSIHLPQSVTPKVTKSTEVQTALEDLLDEIDVNLVLESAVRRCTPEKILMQYKNKMRHVPQSELERETIRMLGSENRPNCNETTLKFACRSCGINKVLLRLPDIFCAEKQFFVKVLNAYRQKIKTSDCMNILDFTEVKDAVCEKCTSSELADMLSKKLKAEEQEGIKKPMTELSSLDAMLKRLPMDVIISHTVANDELIPSRLVLDIALQNNSPSDIAQALESQSPVVIKNVFDKLWSDQFAVTHIGESNGSDEGLLKIFKAVCSKLSKKDLLEAFYECMKDKVTVNDERN
nr:telomere-associated protein RIF1 [Nomia melanderi]